MQILQCGPSHGVNFWVRCASGNVSIVLAKKRGRGSSHPNNFLHIFVKRDGEGGISHVGALKLSVNDTTVDTKNFLDLDDSTH